MLVTNSVGAGLISILIIGNEILSNQVEDHNLKVMLAELNARSYPIDEVRIVRDEIETISGAIRELSAKSRFLISTGGVGPTHDDITFEAYAHAFDVALEVNVELETRLRKWLGDKPMKESMLRMVRLPTNTQLVDLGPNTWPLVQVANCYVLPGLPEVFDKKFKGVLQVLPEVPHRWFAEVFTSSDETDFAAVLTVIQASFPQVEIGSYPTYDRSEFAAHITFKGTDQTALTGAFDRLVSEIQGLGTLVRVGEPAKI